MVLVIYLLIVLAIIVVGIGIINGSDELTIFFSFILLGLMIAYALVTNI